jgi:phosphoribosylaminoimidazole carboxylase PurE protein
MEDKMPDQPKVLIVMGSDTDLSVMEEAKKILTEFGVKSRLAIASAHRTPQKVVSLAKDAEKEGVQVIIAGAGYAAHLAGAIAAQTTLPVIGVPLEGSSLQGLDALLSTVQMPSGIPVATVAIGKTGAKNAGILAAEILALADKNIAIALKEWRKKLAKAIEEREKGLKS